MLGWEHMKIMQNVGSETIRRWSLGRMSVLEENIKTRFLRSGLC